MRRPRILDLFCCAGGAAMGYYRAGFDVVGVDVAAQPRYPFAFIQADALEYLRVHGHEFDAIHASPPCQGYSALRCLPWLRDREYPMLIDPTRELLQQSGKPWIMENVERAPMPNSVVLCGRMFGLPTFRHRRFESNVLLLVPEHVKHDAVVGHGRLLNDRKKGTLNASSGGGAFGHSPIITVAGGQFKKADGERALGITWMNRHELAQAIPPAYTELLGAQLREAVQSVPLDTLRISFPLERDVRTKCVTPAPVTHG